jgi:ABC-type branched-subunit amino acid transport system ATPase component
MTEVIRLEGVHKRFGGIVVAENINLAIGQGDILGLIGPNGAGKTSLFNLISGVVSLDAGSIFLAGQRIDSMPLYRRARAGISRTWQHMRLFHTMTAMENLSVAPRVYGGESLLKVLLSPGAMRREQAALQERGRAILRRLGLADMADKLVSELPFGQQKLIGFARALMHGGECLLLDEPMAGVEGHAYETMQSVVREEAADGRAVCVVEHNISFIKDLCTSAVFMANGRIIQAGTVDELLASSVLAELYFGI